MVLTLLSAMPAWTDYEAGQRDVAIAEWRASAKADEAKAMLALDRLYFQGIGLPQNYVQAHKWFNLAAGLSKDIATAERDVLVAQMTAQAPTGQSNSSAEAIREAQDLLAALGYRPGPADGVWGEQTTQALRAFLRDSGQSSPLTLTETLRLLRNAAQRLVVQRTTNKPFKDCPMCPEVVEVPVGSFLRGSPVLEESRKDTEGPQHEVKISQPLAVGIYEVTFAEWDACVRDEGCRGYLPEDEGWNRGRQPIMNVNWEDAQAYVEWLSEKTGQPYRLLSESEWEYVARAGTQTPFHTGETITPQQANYYSRYSYRGGRIGQSREQPVPVGRFQPNAFGLYDMHGNVWEWVQDCWNMNYAGAPRDGQAWEAGDCSQRVARGGSWYYAPDILRSASRERYSTDYRNNKGGFRVARTLPPRPEPQPFTVVTEPRGARIQIVNIEEPYQAGMALGPGAYEVEVRAAGYETVREMVRHGTEATEQRVVLAALPPQPSPSSRESIRDVMQPEIVPLIQVPPRYPRRAARLQIEGFVMVEFTITPDGDVVEPVVVESEPPRIFDEAALQAIIQWKFEPRMENEQAVESRAKQRIEFGL